MPELTKEQLYIILGIIFVLITGCIYGLFHSNSIVTLSSPSSSTPYVGSNNKQSKQSNMADIKPKTRQIQSIFVQIGGAVDKPGVYKMTFGDRTYDVLQIASVKQGADLFNINMAEPLVDGQKVEIPYTNVINDDKTVNTSNSSGKSGQKININKAEETELDSLPGIGATTAKRIIEYRGKNGRFSSIEALKKVQGITVKKFENLKGRISVN